MMMMMMMMMMMRVKREGEKDENRVTYKDGKKREREKENIFHCLSSAWKMRRC